MFVKTRRNIKTLFLNNQQKITSIKFTKTKGKIIMIKEINQKTKKDTSLQEQPGNHGNAKEKS